MYTFLHQRYQPFPHQPLLLPLQYFLATIDVTSLYTNILHTPRALRPWKNSYPNVLLFLAHFILTHNFYFNLHHYLQVKGTAMGTRILPLPMLSLHESLEEDFLNSEYSKPDPRLKFINILVMESWSWFLSRFPWAPQQSLSCPIYLDHLLFPCNLPWYWRTVDKLGICIFVHIKPTNHQQYLHFSRCHPHPPNAPYLFPGYPW